MKPATPSVLLGIATRNRAGELAKALASARAQTYRPLHIAVIDDGSSDGTPALRDLFADVAWRRWDDRRGVVDARNTMMLSAGAEYYASLDDDARFLEEDALASAIDYLEAHAEVAAVAFDILSPDRPDLQARKAAEPAASFIGCGHVLRLSAVKTLGGYATFPGFYGGEEKDLCLRLIEAGWGIVKMPGLHVWHAKSGQARDLVAQHRSGVCNDLFIIWRRAPLGLLPPFLLWKLARHLWFAGRFGLLRPCLSGIGDFVGVVSRNGWRRAPLRLATFSRYCTLMASSAHGAA
jgi:GT2 family glycosyltransferase